MSKAIQLQSYITYWLDKVDEHSLHSPFYYDLYTKVIIEKDHLPKYEPIEALRKQLLTNDTIIHVDDFGSGAVLKTHSRKIKDIARTSLSAAKYARLYARLIQYFNGQSIIELGTSLGINTLYLAANAAGPVTTFEGSQAVAAVAKTILEAGAEKTINLIEGDIDITLPAFIQHAEKIDFAFMDANHRYEPTLKYFNCIVSRIHTKSLILIDDIHYTQDMEKAWYELRDHPLVYGSIDLYRVGILLFDPSLNKQHAVLQF